VTVTARRANGRASHTASMTGDGPVPQQTGMKSRVWRIAQIALSVFVVVGIFAFAIPKIADYAAVWRAIAAMTWLEIASLVLAMVFNLFTYWWQNMASMPGLGVWQAAVNNQTTTSIADTIPGGGYLAVPLGYAMYRSWGFSTSAIALSVATTGIWNMFMKLGLPIVALALLAVTGQASASLVTASLIGLAVLVIAVVLFALMLWRESLAERIGSGLGRAASAVLRVFRRPAVDWGAAAVRFRQDIIGLVRERWAALTVTTVLSHLALWFVLLLSLRAVGVSEQEISTAQVLGVFAFGRLISALPITPGGVGVVELTYIGGLVLAGRANADVPADVFRAQVAAAVLVFRTLTYVVQIPIGAFTYLIWRSKKDWLREERTREPARA
jgi:putative heme transporter